MDKLEDYINKNRDELDKYNPSADSWKMINSELKKGKTPIVKWISIAAMVVFILGTTIIFMNDRLLVKGNNYGRVLKDPRLKETEIYYNNLINSLYREANPLLTGNPDIKKELNTDILHLDSICSEIKNDLKDNADNQDVIEALIQNYRIKIRMLEDMLSILKETESNKEKPKSYEL